MQSLAAGIFIFVQGSVEVCLPVAQYNLRGNRRPPTYLMEWLNDYSLTIRQRNWVSILRS